jgi:hypothetical protein
MQNDSRTGKEFHFDQSGNDVHSIAGANAQQELRR